MCEPVTQQASNIWGAKEPGLMKFAAKWGDMLSPVADVAYKIAGLATEMAIDCPTKKTL